MSDWDRHHFPEQQGQREHEKSESQEHQPPLHRLAQTGDAKRIDQFICTGADGVNLTDADEWTPLHCAAYSGHVAATKTLITNGAGLNRRDSDGWSPLHRAAFGGHLDVIEVLLTSGIDLGSLDCHGQSVLHLASGEGHHAAVRMLLEAEACPSRPDDDGWTPIHCAAYHGHQAVVKLLLLFGANVRAKTRDGKSLFDVARDRIPGLLREFGLKMRAAYQDHLKLFCLLLHSETSPRGGPVIPDCVLPSALEYMAPVPAWCPAAFFPEEQILPSRV